VSLADAFAGIAAGFAGTIGAPYFDATARWPGVPVKDTGGSITAPGTPVAKPCQAQVSEPTEAMRTELGFVQTDMRLHVLAATLDGVLATQTEVAVLAGPHTGTWVLQSVTRDAAGIGYTCRGRKVG
jgi:hypothetical protein